MAEISKQTGITKYDLITIFGPQRGYEKMNNFLIALEQSRFGCLKKFYDAADETMFAGYLLSPLKRALYPALNGNGLIVIATDDPELMKESSITRIKNIGFDILVNELNIFRSCWEEQSFYEHMIIARKI